jgi:hypothetical protein
VTDDIDEIIAEIEQLDRRRVTPIGEMRPQFESWENVARYRNALERHRGGQARRQIAPGDLQPA